MNLRSLMTGTRDLLAAIVILILFAIVMLVTPRPASASAAKPIQAHAAMQALDSSGCDFYLGSSSGIIRLKLYENNNLDASQRVLCIRTVGAIGYAGSISIPDLKNVSSVKSGYTYNCRLQGPASNGTWNDCVSSDAWGLACSQRVYFYSDSNYGSPYQSQWTRSGTGNDPTYPFGYNDILSSLKIVEDTAWC